MFDRAANLTATICHWTLFLGLGGGLLWACLSLCATWLAGLGVFLVLFPLVALVAGAVIAPVSFVAGLVVGVLASATAAFSRLARS